MTKLNITALRFSYGKSQGYYLYSFGVVGATDKIINGNVIKLCKLNSRPKRKLSLTSFVTLINGELNVQKLGNFFLCFIVIFS